MQVVEGGVVSNLLKDVDIPKLFMARQTFKSDKIDSAKIKDIIYKRYYI